MGNLTELKELRSDLDRLYQLIGERGLSIPWDTLKVMYNALTSRENARNIRVERRLNRVFRVGDVDVEIVDTIGRVNSYLGMYREYVGGVIRMLMVLREIMGNEDAFTIIDPFTGNLVVMLSGLSLKLSLAETHIKGLLSALEESIKQAGAESEVHGRELEESGVSQPINITQPSISFTVYVDADKTTVDVVRRYIRAIMQQP